MPATRRSRSSEAYLVASRGLSAPAHNVRHLLSAAPLRTVCHGDTEGGRLDCGPAQRRGAYCFGGWFVKWVQSVYAAVSLLGTRIILVISLIFGFYRVIHPVWPVTAYVAVVMVPGFLEEQDALNERA